MKLQYVIGVKADWFIRLTDGRELIGGSLTLEEAIDAKIILKNGSIYKLVMVNPKTLRKT